MCTICVTGMAAGGYDCGPSVPDPPAARSAVPPQALPVVVVVVVVLAVSCGSCDSSGF